MARNTRIVGKQIADAVAGGGLKKDASENLELNLKSNAGLSLDTDQLQVVLEASKGLAVGASGIAVDYDDSSIGIVTGKLAVKALGITNDMLAGSIAYSKLSISDGDIAESKLGITQGKLIVGDASGFGSELTVASAQIVVGNASGYATAVDVTGDVTISNAGVTAIGADKVTEAMLNVYNAPSVGLVLGYTANGLEWVTKEASDAITEGDIITGETPSGLINSSNVDYTLANTPVAGTVRVYLNGLRQEEGSGKDYQISGTTITFAVAPDTGDILLVDYFIA